MLSACLSSAGMLTFGIVSAEVYESVDPEGEVSFSDEPSPGATEIPEKEVQTINMPLPEPASDIMASKKKSPGFGGYKKIQVVIDSAEDGTTVWSNSGLIDISVSMDPALQTDRGQKLELLMDGNPVSAAGTSTKFQVTVPGPGARTFQAFVLDQDGKRIAESQPDTAFVHHHVYKPRLYHRAD